MYRRSYSLWPPVIVANTVVKVVSEKPVFAYLRTPAEKFHGCARMIRFERIALPPGALFPSGYLPPLWAHPIWHLSLTSGAEI